jgi:hypothetical protein
MEAPAAREEKALAGIFESGTGIPDDITELT